MKVLVTGAGGQLGGLVADRLLERVPVDQLVLSTRRPAQVQRFADRGVEVRRADFDRPDSLDAAFAGIDRLLLVSTDGDNDTRIRQHTAAVEMAAKAGVGHLSYTSLADAQRSTLPLAPVHRATEDAIVASGLPHTFLRNNWYLANEMGAVGSALAGGPVVSAVGDARIGWVTRADLAAATAVALLADAPADVYELSGPPSSYDDLAAALSQVLGRQVPVQRVDDAGYAAVLRDAGLPAPMIDAFVAFQAPIRQGALDVVSTDLADLLGRPATPLTDAVAGLVAAAGGAGDA